MHWQGNVLALLHTEADLVVLDVSSKTEVGRVKGAGGKGCQEVLYDVSLFGFTTEHEHRAHGGLSGTARTRCLSSSEWLGRRGWLISRWTSPQMRYVDACQLCEIGAISVEAMRGRRR